jgi:hypothetical protein
MAIKNSIKTAAFLAMAITAYNASAADLICTTQAATGIRYNHDFNEPRATMLNTGPETYTLLADGDNVVVKGVTTDAFDKCDGSTCIYSNAAGNFFSVFSNLRFVVTYLSKEKEDKNPLVVTAVGKCVEFEASEQWKN